MWVAGHSHDITAAYKSAHVPHKRRCTQQAMPMIGRRHEDLPAGICSATATSMCEQPDAFPNAITPRTLMKS